MSPGNPEHRPKVLRPRLLSPAPCHTCSDPLVGHSKGRSLAARAHGQLRETGCKRSRSVTHTCSHEERRRRRGLSGFPEHVARPGPGGGGSRGGGRPRTVFCAGPHGWTPCRMHHTPGRVFRRRATDSQPDGHRVHRAPARAACLPLTVPPRHRLRGSLPRLPNGGAVAKTDKPPTSALHGKLGPSWMEFPGLQRRSFVLRTVRSEAERVPGLRRPVGLGRWAPGRELKRLQRTDLGSFQGTPGAGGGRPQLGKEDARAGLCEGHCKAERDAASSVTASVAVGAPRQLAEGPLPGSAAGAGRAAACPTGRPWATVAALCRSRRSHPPPTTRHLSCHQVIIAAVLKKALLVLESCLSEMLTMKRAFALEGVRTFIPKVTWGRIPQQGRRRGLLAALARKPVQVFLGLAAGERALSGLPLYSTDVH